MTNNLFQAYLNGDIAKAGIKDWTQFSNDDVIEALNNNYIQAFIPEIIQTHDIPENVYISFIKKNPTTKYITRSDLLKRIIACEQIQTHDILFELALYNPIAAVYAYDDANIIFTKDEYLRIADIYFQYKYLHRFTWHKKFPMEDRHWDIVLEHSTTRHCLFESYLNRKDRPQKVLCYCSLTQLRSIKNLTTDDLIYWLKWCKKIDKPKIAYFAKNCEHIFNDYKYEFTNVDFTQVIRSIPECIQYIKNPSMDLCKMIINQDAKNIQYIHVDSPDIYWYAIQSSPSAIQYIDEQHITTTMRQFANFANKTYKHKYYLLVDITANTYDGTQVHYKCVINSNNMYEFLNQTFRVYTNEYCSLENLYVRDHITFVPISLQEYETLSKFHMINCQYCEGNSYIKFN